MRLEIQKFGDAVAIVLPEDMLKRLGLQAGDQVVVTEQPDKSLTVASCDADTDRTMQIGREVSIEYRATLDELAK